MMALMMMQPSMHIADPWVMPDESADFSYNIFGLSKAKNTGMGASLIIEPFPDCEATVLILGVSGGVVPVSRIFLYQPNPTRVVRPMSKHTSTTDMYPGRGTHIIFNY